MIMVIDSTHYTALTDDIAVFIHDCEMDGWQVEQLVVSPEDEVTFVKSQIQSIYNANPNSVNTVFLFGHIPVPYSGSIWPDGHNNHIGAWPADVYYADMDGNWTDEFIDETSASQIRNHNIPGDGKFDNSTIPSDVELAIGRVDFHSLPAFAESEEELLRKYLQKNHAFKTKMFDPIRRGLIENNFGSFAEGFGQNGLKSFSPMFGVDSVFYLDYNTLRTESYLWSYGCGGGNYSGASGISNTNNLSNDSLQTVFTMLFGSYFGDWDSNNNFLRAALGSGTVLSNAWAGRPNWNFHPMAMGWPIGHCAKLTQNNAGFSYISGFGNRSIHVALMGDPTLRMHSVRPIPSFEIVEENGHAILNWTIANDNEVGYFIYRKVDEHYERLNDEPTSTNTFIDSCLGIGSYTYMIKTVKLEESASGSYYNLSLGVEQEVEVITDIIVSADFEIIDDNTGWVQFENSSSNATSYLWDFGNGQTSTEVNPTIELEENDYIITLIASNDCTADTISQSISITSDKLILKDLSFEVYPNPVQEMLYINCENCLNQSIQIKVQIGRTLSSFVWKNENTSIEVKDWPAGNYIIQMIDRSGKVYSKTFVKQ
jgi:PKD repeat protein